MIEEWHQHHDNFMPLFDHINKGDQVNIRLNFFLSLFTPSISALAHSPTISVIWRNGTGRIRKNLLPWLETSSLIGNWGEDIHSKTLWIQLRSGRYVDWILHNKAFLQTARTIFACKKKLYKFDLFNFSEPDQSSWFAVICSTSKSGQGNDKIMEFSAAKC